MAPGEGPAVPLIELAERTYDEVLAATKHEDDKVGRLLTAMAFLVAGGLLFVDPEVLQAEYDLATAVLPLPAIALALFVMTVLLSLLIYVAATTAPLTIPSRSGNAGNLSHLYFEMIAVQSDKAWEVLWSGPADELEEAFTREYISESWNIAWRARNKRKRANEASSLFFASILFFGLALGLTIDVYRTGGDPGWTLAPRLWLCAWLVLFLLATLYQRYRQSNARDPANTRLLGYRWLAPAGAGLVIVSMMSADTPWSMRLVLAGIALLAGASAGYGLKTIVNSGSPGWWVTGALAGVVVGLVVLWGQPAVQLGVAVLVALSPLTGQLWESWQETGKLKAARGLAQ